METPVVLLVFNRPILTRALWRIVRTVKPAHLVVVADGPRAGVPGDVQRCQEVRSIFDERIDWPCEIIRVFSDGNLGCARRVSSGLHVVFEQFESAIILEDDCMPDPSFFRFCEELLDCYRDDDRVAVISGDNFQMGAQVTADSYYFSRYPHCWGWATWRRAWRDYDHAMSAWPGLRDSGWLKGCVQSRGEERFWLHAFDGTREGRIDSWANRWTFACWRSDRKTVVPSVNLVSNHGYGPEATHTVSDHVVARLPAMAMTFPLRRPKDVTVAREADARTASLLFKRPSLAVRVIRRLWGMSTIA